MSRLTRSSSLALALLGAAVVTAGAQSTDLYSAMHWREIGPTRAGRARAVSGVPGQPNVAYIGFDNGGVWRSTDYGSTWHPLFDDASTGSIGAIAVAPSDPNVIYVGTGAGIIRPDLSTGDGMYKSTDAGKTWTHLGLRESQMIAHIEVDPHNPNRLFVAALGHPYGPNAERGIFRSTDGGQTFQKVLYKDDYTSGNDVKMDPGDPNTLYADLWQQQQSYIEGGSFGGSSGGIFKSTDGGTTWKPLTEGLPSVLQANLAVSMSNPKVVYAMIAGTNSANGGAPGFGSGQVAFYRTTDGGDHWTLMDGAGVQGHPVDNRPLARIGGGDLPNIIVDPKNENVVYSSSTVLWRTEDGGVTWSAVRGAPGGDDYQKTWINPNNPDIIIQVSDQGGVVSANRGASWSNWYTQPTAAMYHVSTDNTFVYRVCSGQQDSGSACVKSRSDDGEITFHDWHPVNIQEYGEAAPDPKDADLVYGSARTNVSLYNRRTGQTSQVGPGPDLRAGAYGRNVRTMPIEWSPVNPDVLFYAGSAVFKSTDHAHSWTRISPDLARQTWAVPANVGKYASDVRPAPAGSITALSPSPRNIAVIWAGTDDGYIQMTANGGASWTNVTPPSIKPWARVFNIDAGHFDDRTAYAAVNTMRLDDMNPHFFRTHDGGKTWTEIDNGIAPGAVSNSIREDPRQRGLLYAATETQVWVSTDDGDHWSSLRQNMPAVSVRDLLVKDDSACLCSDLIAGTHGRGFWILDDVTPLRQLAAARAAEQGGTAYLFKPATAVRVRFGTNEPTPWPPELPAGQNPPPGGIIDYYLGADATGPVKVEILDNVGKLIQTYSSTDHTMPVHPAIDSAAYNRICKSTPSAAFCALPLYWPAAPMIVSTNKGMHRVSWDLRYHAIGAEEGEGSDDEGAQGAVPHHTYPNSYAPWAPPGNYTVRLTVNGKQYTQPLTLKLDPRVRTPAAALAQVASLSKEMYDGAVAAHVAAGKARGLSAQLAGMQGADAAAFKAQLDSLAPPESGARGRGRGGRGGGGGRGGRGGAANAAPTLDAASNAMMAAAMGMQSADVAPTAAQIDAVQRARATGAEVMARWNRLSTTGLAALNAKLKANGQQAVTIPRGELD